MLRRFGGDVSRHVVEEQGDLVHRVGPALTLGLLALGLGVAGVGPPLARRFARTRRHGRHKHHEVDGDACAHERRRETGHRLRHQDQVPAVADRLDCRLGVVVDAGTVVVARQVGRDHVVTPRSKVGRHQVPVPRVGAGAVQQHVVGHARYDGPRELDAFSA